MMKLSKLTNRVLFISPTVQAGWENQSYRSDFESLSTLGQGSYGTVWKARHKKTGSIYAIKEIKKKTIGSNKMMEAVRREVKIMYSLNHPGIVKLYNHFEDQFSIYFVLQFAEKGELYKMLMKNPNKKFDQATAARYISQVVSAIQYIHSQNVIHRDIKPENILVGKDDELKLADFGWSNFQQGQGKRQTYCGTIDYLAPQMVDDSHLHDHRVDIWSIGVLIYQLCTGLSPFSSELVKQNTVTQAGIKTNIRHLNYKIPLDLSQNCKDLISRILMIKPADRLTCSEILTHPWLSQNNPKFKLGDQERKNWLQNLKSEFGAVMEVKEQDLKKFGAFSKDEIYNCSRIESVINVVSKGKNIEADRKVRQLQLRIKQLQLCNRRQQQQIRFLKNIKTEHQQCSQEIKTLRETVRQQARKIEILSQRIEEDKSQKGIHSVKK